MIKNSISFWFWWTRALKTWFEGKFTEVINAISAALPVEATDAEIDSLFTENNN